MPTFKLSEVIGSTINENIVPPLQFKMRAISEFMEISSFAPEALREQCSIWLKKYENKQADQLQIYNLLCLMEYISERNEKFRFQLKDFDFIRRFELIAELKKKEKEFLNCVVIKARELIQKWGENYNELNEMKLIYLKFKKRNRESCEEQLNETSHSIKDLIDSKPKILGIIEKSVKVDTHDSGFLLVQEQIKESLVFVLFFVLNSLTFRHLKKRLLLLNGRCVEEKVEYMECVHLLNQLQSIYDESLKRNENEQTKLEKKETLKAKAILLPKLPSDDKLKRTRKRSNATADPFHSGNTIPTEESALIKKEVSSTYLTETPPVHTRKRSSTFTTTTKPKHLANPRHQPPDDFVLSEGEKSRDISKASTDQSFSLEEKPLLF